MTMLGGNGERGRLPPHSAHRAPHAMPQPLIGRSHPAAGRRTEARRHATRKARHRASGGGQHQRATLVAAGNPATVRLHGSDTTALWALAQHVTVGSLTVGGAVVGIVFDPADPSDGLLTAVY